MSDKYTKEDVIICPYDSRLLGAVGKKAYFANSATECLGNALVDPSSDYLLEDIVDAYPYFVTEHGARFPFIILKKDENKMYYAERQCKWIKENDIKLGNKVRVIRETEDFEDGWSAFGEDEKDELVGKVFTIQEIDEHRGIGCLVCPKYLRFFPYFILKKVTTKYVPFDLSDQEIKKSLRGRWIIAKNGNEECEINRFNAFEEHKGIWTVNGMSAEYLFNNYTFDDGKPCGMEVWE